MLLVVGVIFGVVIILNVVGYCSNFESGFFIGGFMVFFLFVDECFNVFMMNDLFLIIVVGDLFRINIISLFSV